MAQFRFLQWISGIILVGVIAIACGVLVLMTNAAIAALMFFVLLGITFANSFPNIPNNPLRKGIATILGKYINEENGGVSIGPGRELLWLTGLLFDYIPFDGTRRDIEFESSERTPDNGQIVLKIYLNYEIDQDHPVWFMKAGKLEGVEPKLIDRIDTRIREWIRSLTEGPRTWKEALGSNGLATDVIVAKLFPNEFPVFPTAFVASIPTLADTPIALFVKYFTGQPRLSTDAKIYPEEAALQKTLDDLKLSDRLAWNTLRDAVQERVNFINQVKAGYCDFGMPNLGIKVSNIGISSITAEGITAKAADQVAAQEQLNLVNDLKTKNLADRTEVLKKTGVEPKTALEAIQIQDGAVKKEIKENTVGLEGSNLATIAEVLRGFFPRNNP